MSSRYGDRTWGRGRTLTLPSPLHKERGGRRALLRRVFITERGVLPRPRKGVVHSGDDGLKQAVLLVSAAEATAPLRHRFPAPRTAEIRPILQEARIAFFDEPAGVIVAGSAFQ